MKKGPFSRDEDMLIFSMHENQHAGWGSIGERLGRKPNICAGRYRSLMRLDGTAPIKTVREIEEARQITPRQKAAAVAAETLLSARSLRDHAEVRTGNCTAAFFGDPPPGYSALDRKRAGA